MSLRQLCRRGRYITSREKHVAHELKLQLMRHVRKCYNGSLVVIEEVEQMSRVVLQVRN